MTPMKSSFTFTRDELIELLAGEFAAGWNECSDAFKLDARIVPDGPRGAQNWLMMRR
jgi:hypothetical protein